MAAYFSTILVLITLCSGLIWLYDAVILAPKRQQKLAIAKESQVDISDVNIKKMLAEPFIVENARSIFPVIAFVLILRSFIYEPFQIPSGSMMPTLLVGDFILVEKFSYGLKDPVWRHQLIETGTPKRGDVIVFKYPKNQKLDYIKRVVGLPGDKIVYHNKALYIQEACTAGKKDCPKLRMINRNRDNNHDSFIENNIPLLRYKERLGDVEHDILINPERRDPTAYYYHQEGSASGEFVVPKDQYFVMGDNRDNSEDSRFWGFVPKANLVGKAVAIWISFQFDRTSADFLPAWVPTGVRFNRIGSIN